MEITSKKVCFIYENLYADEISEILLLFQEVSIYKFAIIIRNIVFEVAVGVCEKVFTVLVSAERIIEYANIR